MKLSQVAIQFYTLRDLIKTPADVAKTCKRVREIGYSAVQISGMGPIAESELKAILDGEGLVCCATHEPSDVIRENPQAVVDRLRALDCKLTAYPFPRGVNMGNTDDVAALACDLNDAGKLLSEAGLTLTYHNHGVEFIKTDGITALDRIYNSTNPAYLQGEPDTYWIHYGGGDVVEWCGKLKGRLPMIHLKDYCFTAEEKPTYCEIGNGTLNFRRIIAAAEASGCEWFIVEQDVCPGDPFDSIKQSYDYIAANLCD